MTVLIMFIFILCDSENAMSRQQPKYENSTKQS